MVLLAHGGLRSAPDSGAWIAARLAAEGFVVVAPQPPRLDQERAKDAPKELWLRPADLSAALTAVASDPALGARLDAQAIGVLGFQLGGSAALALVGARIDGQRYAGLCDQGGSTDCAWFARHDVDLHDVDAALAERPGIDGRIRAAVAVDPEWSDVFEPASLAEIAAPVLVMNLGSRAAIQLASDGSSLAHAIPGARYDIVADASPFSAFNLCQPRGPAILREEGDDAAICEDGQRPRAEVQGLLAAMIVAFLRAHVRSAG